uniref:Uncharacterized protein n=1 Tax=Timema tahoe TaxID=61484 RepID=A0A7R9IC60_9NEOP|nr:unnamed protein product [Timema tahoe]
MEIQTSTKLDKYSPKILKKDMTRHIASLAIQLTVKFHPISRGIISSVTCEHIKNQVSTVRLVAGLQVLTRGLYAICESDGRITGAHKRCSQEVCRLLVRLMAGLQVPQEVCRLLVRLVAGLQLLARGLQPISESDGRISGAHKRCSQEVYRLLVSLMTGLQVLREICRLLVSLKAGLQMFARGACKRSAAWWQDYRCSQEFCRLLVSLMAGLQVLTRGLQMLTRGLLAISESGGRITGAHKRSVGY